MLPKLPLPIVPVLWLNILVIVYSAKIFLNQNMFLFSPNLPTAAAILFLFVCPVNSSNLIILGCFLLFLSQSEPICNMHWCYVKAALVF